MSRLRWFYDHRCLTLRRYSTSINEHLAEGFPFNLHYHWEVCANTADSWKFYSLLWVLQLSFHVPDAASCTTNTTCSEGETVDFVVRQMLKTRVTVKRWRCWHVNLRADLPECLTNQLIISELQHEDTDTEVVEPWYSLQHTLKPAQNCLFGVNTSRQGCLTAWGHLCMQ